MSELSNSQQMPAMGGFAVISVASGEEAPLMIKTRTIDLVLLDLMLPGMDGLQVSRKIKDNKK